MRTGGAVVEAAAGAVSGAAGAALAALFAAVVPEAALAFGLGCAFGLGLSAV